MPGSAQARRVTHADPGPVPLLMTWGCCLPSPARPGQSGSNLALGEAGPPTPFRHGWAGCQIDATGAGFALSKAEAAVGNGLGRTGAVVGSHGLQSIAQRARLRCGAVALSAGRSVRTGGRLDR